MLTQIIVEEEAKGQNLLPISVLRQLISLYGDSLQFLVPRYLEQAMQTFARNQEQIARLSFGDDAQPDFEPSGAAWHGLDQWCVQFGGNAIEIVVVMHVSTRRV